MRIWLTTIGEPVPIQEAARDRLHRTGYFAHFLAEHGHDVVWWTSTFDHMRKKHWFDHDHVLRVNGNLEIRLLHGCGYRSNVSLARIRDHRQIARTYAEMTRREPSPDIVVAALPTIELCLESVRYGTERHIPVVLDMRDMWPDILLELLPAVTRPIGRLALWPMFRDATAACAGATAVIGMTEAFVDWGLARGGRARTDRDRSFSFGYAKRQPVAEAISAAEDYWRRLGIAAENGEFIVCFFGNISRQFELEPVIDAARLLENDPRPIRFVICGAGDRFEHYRRMADGCRRLLFPGWVGAAEIWTLLRMASLGLAPYRETPNFVLNIANKPAEYLSGGVPIALSLRHGVLHDLLEANDCGFSYGRDPEELARGIRRLADDPQHLGTLKANAARVFAERFEAEKVYGQMMAHLEKLVAEGKELSKNNPVDRRTGLQARPINGTGQETRPTE